MGFDGVKNDKLPRFLHETAKEDKGKELILEGFKFLLLIDAKDTKVSPLHVMFDLKGVFVGKEYFKIITSFLCHLI